MTTKTENGVTWFLLEDGDWAIERNICQHCRDELEAARKPYRWAEEQYSFGIYAGRYCDDCWPKSGYRDAVDPNARFDPADAGESLEAEQ